MMWKKTAACAILSALVWIGTANAYDVKNVADEQWPSMFTYTEIGEEHMLLLPEGNLSYRLGQVLLQPPETKNVMAGYIVTAEFPPREGEKAAPYFKEYLTVHEWRGLVKINRLLMNSGSPLRIQIEELIRSGHVPLPEELRSSANISLEEIEPYHRLSFTESYLYVAAGRIVFDMAGMKFPFYGRVYFFRHDDHMDMMLLLTPDEAKEPLIYVTDVLAKTVAKEIYMNREGAEDLSVTLAKYQEKYPPPYEKERQIR